MLIEKINQDLVTAQKAKDELTLSCLRMLKSAIKYVAIQKLKDSLDETEIIEVISKQIKQRKDSVEAFTKGNRPDLAKKEEKEIEILSVYLPKALTLEELKAVIQDCMAKTQAKTKADKWKLMKEVMVQVRGRSEGSQISQLVDQLLS
jgi:hypothetical protein